MNKRAVLVIDNGPIRQRYFLEAQKVLQKIERLEEKIQRFHTSDQKLFNQWMDLTFRKHRAAQEKAQSQYLELARFHNWVVATAHQLNIEMPAAYKLMREEQIRWEAGNEEVRQEISLARERREAYIRNQQRGNYNEQYANDAQEDHDPSNGGIEGLESVLDQIEENVLDYGPEPLETAEERIDRLIALPDEALIAALELQETSFMLFDVSLNWGQKHQDYSLFKRLWLLMTMDQKDFFARAFALITEAPIEEFLQDIGLPSDWSDEYGADLEHEADEAAFNEEYDEEYIGSPREKPTAKPEAGMEERLKLAFRKLMRKLHPDMHVSETKDGAQPAWVQRIWGAGAKSVQWKRRRFIRTVVKTNFATHECLGRTVGQ